jgi:hypothetical protein
MIASVDENGDGSIQFNEFLDIMKGTGLGSAGEGGNLLRFLSRLRFFMALLRPPHVKNVLLINSTCRSGELGRGTETCTRNGNLHAVSVGFGSHLFRGQITSAVLVCGRVGGHVKKL